MPWITRPPSRTRACRLAKTCGRSKTCCNVPASNTVSKRPRSSAGTGRLRSRMWSAPSQSETSALSTRSQPSRRKKLRSSRQPAAASSGWCESARSPGRGEAACPAPGPSVRPRRGSRRPTCVRARGGCPRTVAPAPRRAADGPCRAGCPSASEDVGAAGSSGSAAPIAPAASSPRRPTIVRCRPSSRPTCGRQPSRLELLRDVRPPHGLERPVGERADLGRRRGEGVADLLDHLAHGDELAAAEVERLALDPGDLGRGEEAGDRRRR